MNKNQCLICFKSLYDEESLSSLFSLSNIICKECMAKFKIINNIEVINGIDTWFLYQYDDFMKSLIYQYKGCYDIELARTFLFLYKEKIEHKYHGYTIIYPPSSGKDDFKRKFTHMEEIAKTLKLKNEKLFYKKVEYKQSEHHFDERKDINQVIDIIKGKQIHKKKYLIIDDIYTSGSTLKAIEDILLSKGVDKKHIKALIISKVK